MSRYTPHTALPLKIETEPAQKNIICVLFFHTQNTIPQVEIFTLAVSCIFTVTYSEHVFTVLYRYDISYPNKLEEP
jgi:hypothetical protein